MIRRIYIFIILGFVLENCWQVFDYFGASDEFLYYRIFPACQKLEITLLPLWWLLARLLPFKDKENETWLYTVASTYLIFQCIDAADMIFNENQRDSTIDYVMFLSLNLTYWLIFRRR